jgi:hypothetical protein
MRLRRSASMVTVVLLTGGIASSTSPASGGQIRTDTSLGGFSVSMNSAPLKLLFDDPTVPIPRPPGSAVVEADPSYTLATLDTGPNSRALASSLWPGTLFGDGWSQVVGTIPIPGIPASYPLKADAKYPDNPHVATAQDNGAFMNASALGLDVIATARANPPGAPSALDLGTASSTSTATVKNGVAIGKTISQVTDVSLLGLIKVGSVSTTLTTSSDGKKPSSSGTTVVNGLTIAGMGYVVDQNGAHPVGLPVGQGTGVLPTTVLDPAKMLGITISGLSQEHSQDADSATRVATGLKIVIDTAPLRAAISPVTGKLQGPLAQIISMLPKDPTGHIPFSPQTLAYMAVQTTPKITLILGSGQGTSAATLPISFIFPPTTFPTIPGQPATVPGVSTSPVISVPGVTNPGPTGPGPTVEQPVTKPLASTSPKNPFHGIPIWLLLLVAAAAGTAGYGLLGVRNVVLAKDAGTSLPDLRGA